MPYFKSACIVRELLIGFWELASLQVVHFASGWRRMKHASGTRQAWTALHVLLFVVVMGIVLGGRPAYADPACQAGAYTIFAPGSQEHRQFNVDEARRFSDAVSSHLAAMGIPSIPVELGNLDGDFVLEADEYPAVYGVQWVAFPGYSTSVNIGVEELVKHLNERTERCPQEVLVLGGFSQGANVIVQALARQGAGSLSAWAKSRIAFVALYGDPVFNNGGGCSGA